jgi:hypothetical protein
LSSMRGRVRRRNGFIGHHGEKVTLMCFQIRAPRGGICIKLSVYSLHEYGGFALVV